jgi:hypothetical protein
MGKFGFTFWNTMTEYTKSSVVGEDKVGLDSDPLDNFQNKAVLFPLAMESG